MFSMFKNIPSKRNFKIQIIYRGTANFRSARLAQRTQHKINFEVTEE